MQKCICGAPIASARWDLGIKKCLACGQKEAEREIGIKKTQVGPAFNKGGMQYLGGSNFKQNMLDAGRKTSAYDIVDMHIDTEHNVVRATASVKTSKKQKPIGLVYVEGQAYSIYSEDDPRLKTATRYAIFDRR